jgi:hypothetical protein
VGLLIAASALTRDTHPKGSRPLSLLNLMLALWIIASPWIYGYQSEVSRTANSVCVGVPFLLLAGAGSFAFDNGGTGAEQLRR